MNDSLLPDLFICPQYGNATVCISFTKPQGFEAGSWEIYESERVAASGSFPVSDSIEIQTRAELPGFKPWSVNHPFLYSIKLKMIINGAETVISKQFGMCKAESQGKKLFFNGREIYLKGVIRGREAHDHPNLMGMPEKEFYRKYIRLAKDFGFNFIRFHSRIPSEAYFEAADEEGILTHVEIRKYFGKYQKERKALDDLDDKNPALVESEQWVETVKSIRNHPSMLVYCMGNEIDNPGKNPAVKKIYQLTHELDPNKLFLDTCGRGEYDRKNVDLDVKHMGYFCPFGEHYKMFNTTRHCGVFGSAQSIPVRVKPENAGTEWEFFREIPVNYPIIAHEICHYTAHRDIDELNRKFDQYAPDQKPWWIGELKKLIREKGLEKDVPRMREASKRFQFLWWKQGLESVRRSPLLAGFQFFQISDTERYENSNSILDCFDDFTFARAEDFASFNGDTVLLADLPRRTFFEKEEVEIGMDLSHFGEEKTPSAIFRWSISETGKKKPVYQGILESVDVSQSGLSRIGTLRVRFPESEKARQMVLRVSLEGTDQKPITENQWDLWVFPNRAADFSVRNLESSVGGFDLGKRYPGLNKAGNVLSRGALLIADRFGPALMNRLEKGGDVLMLYRVPEHRDKFAKPEKYYLPGTRDRFKGTIWDRGHNSGGFLRKKEALTGFPNDGFFSFQFAGLVDDADKICLDDFPVPVEPLFQGVDKASRDRFDVHKFGLSEFQPAYTLRKFAYLVELKVGKGRLLVCGFNLSGIEKGIPESCAMFETLIDYMRSKKFKPAASITPDQLKEYLLSKGKAPRIKERMMTQYWQLDNMPVESAQYWKDSEAWIRENKAY